MKVYTQQYSQQTNDRAGFRSLSILMRLLEAFLKDISVAERFITLVFFWPCNFSNVIYIPFCLNAMICMAPF